MKIVADENIPFVREACQELGEVTLMPGRAITNAALQGVNCLFVRSVSKVGKELLSGTPVRFVGTATIGLDHIDQGYLAEAGIVFSSAPGSNANSVAGYIVAALHELAQTRGFSLSGKTLGIVGVGNVGSRVAAKAKALGMKLLLNDPPRERKQSTLSSNQEKIFSEAVTADEFYSSSLEFISLEELLPQADIITLHTPLEKAGEDPTFHLANAEFFAKLKKGAIFINSSRGAVCDQTALHSAIDSGRVSASVLDVWEGEPRVDMSLLQKATIATPHIAGYSFDGKVSGTTMIVNAARQFFNQPEGGNYNFSAWDPTPLLPEPKTPTLSLDATNRTVQEVITEVVRATYNIMADDAAMRLCPAMPPAEQVIYFDQMRKEYPQRREFFNTEITLKNPAEGLAKALAGIGFKVN